MAGRRKKNQKEDDNKIASKNCNSNNTCGKHIFDKGEIRSIQENLLEWFDKEQRTLPWRDIAKFETDENIRGYSVWVSEVMLQQTQVATVIPYFNKWIEKWPTVKDLAKANLEEVLQTWAGLGYYSRGRRLHEGAKIVMEKLNGRIPQDVSKLMDIIPGIGAYSASAIASVAFQKVAGVVDGNVIRVLSRMRVIGSPASVPSVRDHLWKQANELVSRKRPGDFNQALMELGAMVCTPNNPSCSSCPVSSVCHAYSMTKTTTKDGALYSFLNSETKNKDCIKNIPDIENSVDCSFCVLPSVWRENPQVTAFPYKAEKKSPRKETVKVIVIEHSNKFLTVRRPEKGLLAGLLEFPSLIVPENYSNLKSSTLQPLMKEFNLSNSDMKSKKHRGEVVHLFSHIHTTYVVDHLILNHPLDVKGVNRETMWISEEEIKTAAISTAMKKVFSLVRKSEKISVKEIKSNNKKRKTSSEDSKQKSIKSFFS